MRFLTVLFAMFVAFVSSAHAIVAIGERAPQFQLTDHEGNLRSMEEFLGKVVVLEWTNHKCPFVRKHYDEGHMQHLQKAFTDRDVVWLSIISSAPGKQGHVKEENLAKARAAERSHSILLMDPQGRVGRAFGARTTPHMFIVDEEGFVVYQGAIDSIPSFRTEDIFKADNYIVQANGEMFADIPVRKARTTPYGCSVKY